MNIVIKKSSVIWRKTSKAPFRVMKVTAAPSENKYKILMGSLYFHYYILDIFFHFEVSSPGLEMPELSVPSKPHLCPPLPPDTDPTLTS